MNLNDKAHASDNTEAMSAGDSMWIRHKKYLYLTSLALPGLPILTAYLAASTGEGLWLWAYVSSFYLLFSLIDHLLGKDPMNPDAALAKSLVAEKYYVNIMYLATALHWVAVFYIAYVAGTGDWPWYHLLGAALSLGLASGLGLVAGHELGHKVNDKKQMLAAKLILACSGYGHFTIEHNKGHHKDVATPEDPASSRMGESIYRFVFREIPGAARRAWELEGQRLQRQGKRVWSLQNEILQPALVTASAYTLIVAALGWKMLPFLLVASAFAWWQLTCANYVEHYGLKRLKRDDGRYERCLPKHSWNSNSKASNLVLLHLQRHSDHHARPTVPYQILRDYDDVPVLPFGYPFMFVLAMLPPLWFWLMDKRVAAWAEGDLERANVEPAKSERLFRRYHKPLAA